MTDHWTDRLSEYLDGELAAEDREAIELHLTGCAGCRQVLAELKAVVMRAGALADREPESDLWTGIAGAIGAGTTGSTEVVDLASHRRAKRFTFSLPQLLAAAATLVLVTGGSVWFGLAQSGLRGEPGLSLPAPSPVALRVVSFDPRGRADSAIAELERVLSRESGQLDTSTVRILRQNLALIDRAIEQARNALEQDPSNPYLNDHLARTMRKKIDVLRHAADLAAAQS